MPKNFVSNKDETRRMFRSDVLERLSHIHYTVPLYIFVPVILFFLYRALAVFSLGLIPVLGFISVGIGVWTLTEYVLHRFVFHWTPPGTIGARVHFMFHGVHHDYPNDSKRLVMVPVVSIPLAALFYFFFYVVFGERYVAPFFVGFISGYLFYDMTHYAVHHANLKSRFWLELKQHHMLHHFVDAHNGYGVSSKFWDIVFKTMFTRSESRLPGKHSIRSSS
jgi:sterol desaturase/sphingolipid hydroxylase (fatty acid hydroxylase superfamily)